MTEDIKQHIKELREALREHEYRYYVLAAPVISDKEFDDMMHELERLEQQHPEERDANSPTQRPGSDLSAAGFEQFEHRYPMLSLANTYSEGEVKEWYERVVKSLNRKPEIVCELKFDGVSISLIYKNGKLVRALTRGDGVKGDDVTRNVRTIRTVPLVLIGDYPNEIELRGEILMPWERFEALNKERADEGESLFANPRNATSGSIKLLNSKEVAHRGLTNYVYYMLGEELPSDSHFDNMERARQWGLNVSDAMKVCKSIDEVIQYIDYWDKARRDLAVATDGMVLKVNDLNDQLMLGYTAKSPRWAIAYKFEAEKALTRLESVSYQTGRTGVVTPVANLEPVHLSGTVVRRATLHNADFMHDLDLHEGDMVYVEKGGEIIPKITAVELSMRAQEACAIEFTKVCPDCGATLVREADQAAWRCPNTTGCATQICTAIEHFVSRKAMNIEGLGSEIISTFYKKGLLKNPADLYSIRPEQIASIERMGEKSASNIVNSIRKSTEVPFERVLFALGIRYVGATVAKRLAEHFSSIDALRNATVDELTNVSDIGESIANSVRDYFDDPANISYVEQLRSYGLQMESKQKEIAGNNRLNGAAIVISGVFAQHTRDEYKEIIEANGGRNVSAVSAKTDFLLTGDNAGQAKLQKAEQLGVKILTEEEFLKMIGE